MLDNMNLVKLIANMLALFLITCDSLELSDRCFCHVIILKVENVMVGNFQSRMSPERSGSPQDDQATTPKMSVPASPVAGTPTREAQSPISLLLAVAQSQSTRNGDDDLTNLAWLHERDLLKGQKSQFHQFYNIHSYFQTGMNLVNPSPMSSVHSTPVKYLNNNHILSDQLPISDYIDESSAAESSNSSLNSPVSHQNHRKHPHNIPYDPLVHTSNKPPYSFSCLIFMAIEDSEQKALPVKEIYAWILDHFPYFRNAPTGWKNSVRHNLSLNKCFQKVEKAPVGLSFFKTKQYSIAFVFIESWQRIFMDSRPAVQTKSSTSTHTFTISSMFNT